jgi:hypothetical protein
VYHGPAVVRLSRVQPSAVRWLWTDRLALGKLTLLAGDPGLGKSYLTLDLAARVSSGRPLPSEAEPGDADNRYGKPPRKVILLSAEDDPADTIRPRLDAAAADPDNVLLLEGIRTHDTVRPTNLRHDIEHLDRLVSQLHGECRLIVIDPISAYLGDDEGHSNTKVRHLLAPLAKLAQDHHLAVLAVTHLNKGGGSGGGGQSAIYRTMGSLAFTAAARAVHLVARDPDDPDGPGRLMLPIKNNLGHDRTGWGFRLEAVRRAARADELSPADRDVDASLRPSQSPAVCRTQTRVVWDAEPTQESADALLARLARASASDAAGGRPTPALDEAVAFLKQALAEGGLPMTRLQESAEAMGISKATLKRARHEAGVAVRREGGRHGHWVWALPQSDPAADAKRLTPGDGLLYGNPPAATSAQPSSRLASEGMG